jgi:selenocysteine-specific elongation factor
MIIGTAGHIDHGKTSLVRALTGVDTDRLPEEKRRGITIELGFAPLVLDGVGLVGIVDVPGHEAFVRTMVAGASGIDAALLVIAADEGVMPQTREHLSILTLLGTRTGVVALTKRDLVDDEWLALVTTDVLEVLLGSPLEDAPVVPVSATTGDGLGELRAALGDALRALPSRDALDTFRMPIDRTFSVRGTGTVVTGTIWEGAVAPGDALVVQPAAKPVRVRGVQVHGTDVPRAQPGSRAALAITGVDVSDVTRGSWLCGDGQWPVTTLMRAEVSLLPDASHPLRPREWIRFHLGTADVGARIVAPGGILEPASRRPARVVLQEPVLARAGDRFVLRLASPPATIGGGVVVDPLPPRRRSPVWDAGATAEEALGRVLLEAAKTGVERSLLPVRLGIPLGTIDALTARLGAVEAGPRVFHQSALSTVRSELIALVNDVHHRNPLGDGLPTAGLQVTLHVAEELLERAIAELVAEGRIERRGAVLAAGGWQPVVSQEDAQFRERLLGEIRAAGTEPPDVATLAEEHGRDPVPLLRLLEREHLVVAVESGRFYAAEVLARLVTRLRDGMTEGREYSPSELREVLGLSRKYLIPFLEYCDRKRITERRATGRVRVAALA